jgi:hypothetical protein
MPSVAAEAMAVVVAAELAAEASVAARSAAAEASAAVMVADSAVVSEVFAEDMAASDMAGSGAVIGAAGALDWDGVGAGPVTRMDTLMVMDILTPTDIRDITEILMLTPDSKHMDPLLPIKRHLLPTAAQ